MMLEIEPLPAYTHAQMLARRKELRLKFWGKPRVFSPMKFTEPEQTPSRPIVVSAQATSHQNPDDAMADGAIEHSPATDLASPLPSLAPLEPPAPLPPRSATIQRVLKVVSAYYQVSVADIKSSKRRASIVRPRQIACYLANALTTKSTTEIGNRIGKRDHTTVIFSI